MNQNLNAKGSSTYTWTIPMNSIKKSGSFYAAKGSKVAISVNPDPVDADTGIGLDQPNGKLRGVSDTGTYGYTFTINESGYYKVYVRNEDGKQINAVAVFRKESYF
ncbi:MAG: hypothetical protein HFI65_01765 [Lachnospiraceae bacterium]|nr:hypothetical protein [Lachnospiraceae bacterium]